MSKAQDKEARERMATHLQHELQAGVTVGYQVVSLPSTQQIIVHAQGSQQLPDGGFPAAELSHRVYCPSSLGSLLWLSPWLSHLAGEY